VALGRLPVRLATKLCWQTVCCSFTTGVGPAVDRHKHGPRWPGWKTDQRGGIRIESPQRRNGAAHVGGQYGLPKLPASGTGTPVLLRGLTHAGAPVNFPGRRRDGLHIDKSDRATRPGAGWTTGFYGLDDFNADFGGTSTQPRANLGRAH